MSIRSGGSLSADKMPGNPPSAVQDSKDKKTIHERTTVQSLADDFKKSPYSRIKTIIAGLDNYGLEYCGIEIADVSRQPTFLQGIHLDDVERKSNFVQHTSHPNLLNLVDASVSEGILYLHYERPGVSLADIQQLKALDRIAVSTICKKILHGLIFIHDILDISHGNLHCGNIYLNQDGEIKIGDVGKSMVQTGKTKDLSRDVESVLNIAEDLLDLDGSSDKASMSWIMAKNFITIPSDIHLRSLLKHPFLRISQDSWYLSYLGEILSFSPMYAYLGISSSKIRTD